MNSEEDVKTKHTASSRSYTLNNITGAILVRGDIPWVRTAAGIGSTVPIPENDRRRFEDNKRAIK